jgi:enoyl-CoA hydratase
VSYQTLLYEPGPVARVILNRPERHNTQSWELLSELDDVLRAASADSDVRIIVLSGSGESFSAGHDTDAPEPRSDRDAREAGSWFNRTERYRDVYLDSHLRWRGIPKPTLAMVHGYCAEGGWMVASAMDVIFAAQDALFIPVYGDYFTTAWDLGARKAKEVLFENRFLSAQEAMDWGFVNRVYPAQELEAATLKYAGRVAEHSPFSLRTIKFAINQTLDQMGFSASVRALGGEFHAMAPPRQPSAPAPVLSAQPLPPGTPAPRQDPRFRGLVGRAMQYLREDGRHPDAKS